VVDLAARKLLRTLTGLRSRRASATSLGDMVYVASAAWVGSPVKARFCAGPDDRVGKDGQQYPHRCGAAAASLSATAMALWPSSMRPRRKVERIALKQHPEDSSSIRRHIASS